MRIISGEGKGRVLKTREGKGTRPTDSRVREMLFNILGESVQESRFLDLYAGNGSVGLEALSRGAAFCVFVEQNAAAAQAIRDNLKTLGWRDRAQVWHTPLKSALRRFSELLEKDPNHPEARFDIVFADPPFTNRHELQDLAARLDNLPQLLHNGTGQKPPEAAESVLQEPLLVVQHYRKEVFRPARFTVWQQRRAGNSALTFCHPLTEKPLTESPTEKPLVPNSDLSDGAGDATPSGAVTMKIKDDPRLAE